MSMGAYVAVLTRLTTSMHCPAQLAQVLDIMWLYQMTVSLTLYGIIYGIMVSYSHLI